MLNLCNVCFKRFKSPMLNQIICNACQEELDDPAVDMLWDQEQDRKEDRD